MPSTPEQFTPQRLHLDRARQLEITWADGQQSIYSLSYLRSNCPCASCRKFRDEQQTRKSLLTILPGNYTGALHAVKAEMVGNYAIRIDWSDDHGSGIYSFEYLHGIRPPN